MDEREHIQKLATSRGYTAVGFDGWHSLSPHEGGEDIVRVTFGAFKSFTSSADEAERTAKQLGWKHYTKLVRDVTQHYMDNQVFEVILQKKHRESL